MTAEMERLRATMRTYGPSTNLLADLKSANPDAVWSGPEGLMPRAALEIERLSAALTAISDLQGKSFVPAQNLISVAIHIARNAIAEVPQ
jgi:hypothetical protein